MAAVVWFTVGLALWHFTVFVPDRFWGGIVGALLGAIAGAMITGAIAQIASGSSIGADRHRHRPGRDPGHPGRAWRRSMPSASAKRSRWSPEPARGPNFPRVGGAIRPTAVGWGEGSVPARS